MPRTFVADHALVGWASDSELEEARDTVRVLEPDRDREKYLGAPHGPRGVNPSPLILQTFPCLFLLHCHLQNASINHLTPKQHTAIQTLPGQLGSDTGPAAADPMRSEHRSRAALRDPGGPPTPMFCRRPRWFVWSISGRPRVPACARVCPRVPFPARSRGSRAQPISTLAFRFYATLRLRSHDLT